MQVFLKKKKISYCCVYETQCCLCKRNLLLSCLCAVAVGWCVYRSQVDQLRLKLMEILIKNKKIGNEIIIDDNKNKVANTQKNVALMSKNSSDFGEVILFFH